MTGKPNPKSGDRLTLQARNEAEKQLIKKFKEILREKGTYGLEILKPTVEEYVKKHWPPNPQTQVLQYIPGQQRLPLSLETQATLRRIGERNREETCPECNGQGRNSWGAECRGCNGIGKIGVEKR